MSGIKELFGSGVVVDKAGNAVDLEKHCAGKQVGIYFSAHWCPPCRGFTPVLAKTYGENNTAGNFEIIFISSDRDEESFNEYYEGMPWLALDYKDRKSKDDLSNKFGIRGIPSLVVVDGDTGDIITPNGRAQVTDGIIQSEGRFINENQ